MINKNFALPAAALLAVVALSACAGPAENDDASETPSPTPSSTSPGANPTQDDTATTTQPSPEESEEPASPTLAVTINGDDVGPNAEEISVDAGETVTIIFDTDRAGELHVHSKPEQFVEFDSGQSTKELVIETPGIVEVEEHDSEAVVAVIEVK